MEFSSSKKQDKALGITCVKRRSCAWVHFQGRGKWRKRHGSRWKALNKRTGIKFYQSPHSLKNPIVGSLGTSARSYLRSLPRQQENLTTKAAESESGLTPWDPAPLGPTAPTSGTADPSPALRYTHFGTHQTPPTARHRAPGRPSRACAYL